MASQIVVLTGKSNVTTVAFRDLQFSLNAKLLQRV